MMMTQNLLYKFCKYWRNYINLEAQAVQVSEVIDTDQGFSHLKHTCTLSTAFWARSGIRANHARPIIDGPDFWARK